MSEPTFVSIQLGIRLREFREAAGLTLRDVKAAGMIRNINQLSKLENGLRVMLTTDGIGRLCDLYGTSPEDKYVTQQMFIKAEADAEWWEPYGEVMFQNISMLFSLERHASKIFIYDPLVNGLFQTREYANLLHQRDKAEDAKRKVELRMQRQAGLWEPPFPEVQLMMPESALWGDCDQAQLDRLLERDQLPGVSVRYLPTREGSPPALMGPFTVILFETGAPDVVYSESISGARYESRDDAVKRHLTRYTPHFEGWAKSVKEFRRD